MRHMVIVTPKFNAIEAWLSEEGVKDVARALDGSGRLRPAKAWFGKKRKKRKNRESSRI